MATILYAHFFHKQKNRTSNWVSFFTNIRAMGLMYPFKLFFLECINCRGIFLTFQILAADNTSIKHESRSISMQQRNCNSLWSLSKHVEQGILTRTASGPHSLRNSALIIVVLTPHVQPIFSATYM
ncbi:hypothetical protein XELAEV_18018220mg [Xenopus laevis]|uniref:Uncharacterized protein n=1 Tax=Xenopus laevis TaxID=8355 RepID=A0A974DD32_XENLA|nr:hypothetical protein XELAEV_18018220mg [Xenopus laevis]